jgi:hypothetical protein
MVGWIPDRLLACQEFEQAPPLHFALGHFCKKGAASSLADECVDFRD